MMKMIDKIAKQKELNGLVLFKEGIFLKAYNESAYILAQLLHQNLKIKCYAVKSLKNRVMTECAFPCSALAKRLPTAVQTVFGAQLCGDYDLSGYGLWQARHWDDANAVSVVPIAAERPLQTVSAEATSRQQLTVYKPSISLSLTQQQLTYLQTWQKGLYPLEVDSGFIESLKQQMTPSAK